MVSQRGRWMHRSEEDMDMEARPVISLSCSDDEEANVDLSLEIVERAKKKRREVEDGRSDNKKRDFPGPDARRAPAVIDLSSTSDEGEGVPRRRGGRGTVETSASAAAVEGSKKKKKKKRKKKQRAETDDEGALVGGSETVKVDVAAVNYGGEITEIPESIGAEADGDVSDNIVFRKLLRGPRYFDPGSTRWESCFNCGEEGHVAANCTAEKRKKPCFVCGMFGHNANKCTQGQDCFICKRRGHFAKDCPDKHQRISQDNKICLRCGDMGHDMSSCGNDYPTDDLKKIQCYVCKDFGHFCCVDFVDTAPRETTCYNCGGSGHSGIGCAKPRGESIGTATPTLCYVCGEEGHFARGCTKKSKHGGPSTSTPKSFQNKTTPRHSWNKKDYWASKSPHHDFERGSRSQAYSNPYNKKKAHYEGRRNMTSERSRVKHGWIVDDPGEWPSRDRELRQWRSPKNKSWKSPSTPRTSMRKSYKHHNSAGSYHQYHVQ